MTHELAFVPGFDAALQAADAAHRAHDNLERSLADGWLTRRNRLQVALAVSEASGSDYCRWAHACAARVAGLSGEDIALACAGTGLERRERTIARLAARVSRGGRIDFRADNFRDVDLAPPEIRDVMAQVALTLLEDFILRSLDPESHGAPA